MREGAGLDADVRVVGRVHPYLALANQAADVAVEALGPSAEDWNLFFAVFSGSWIVGNCFLLPFDKMRDTEAAKAVFFIFFFK